MPSKFTTEVLAIKCRACDALPGSKCIVGATGATATKPHNVRVADAADVESLFTPDPQTADEFSEYDTEVEPEPELEPEPEVEVETTIQWTDYPAKDVQPGMVIEHKGKAATVASRRVTDKWVTAHDQDMNTLLYVKPDSVIRVWL